MPENKIEIVQYKCAKCNHVWIPRKKGKPKVCPVCKRYDWDKENK